MLALAGVAFAVGAIVGSGRSSSPADVLAGRFVGAWTRGDYATMYSEIDAASQRSMPASAFAVAYQDALTTATASRLRLAGRAARAGASSRCPFASPPACSARSQ
jgi:hypothetical protein